MIVLSGALVLVALVLLVFGALDRNLPYVYASIGVSVLSLLLLLVGILQRRDEFTGQDEDGGPTPVTDTSDELTPALVGAQREASQLEPVTSELPVVAPVAAPEPAPPTSSRLRTSEPPQEPEDDREHLDEQDADDQEFEDDELEDDDVEDDELEDDDVEDDELEDEPDAGGSGVTVLVVSGRPRYHLEGCRVLRGKEPQPLDRDDARTHGFSPCGVCRPDADDDAVDEPPDLDARSTDEPQVRQGSAAGPSDAEEEQSFTATLFGGPLFTDAPDQQHEGGEPGDALSDHLVRPALPDVQERVVAQAGTQDVDAPSELSGDDPADDVPSVGEHAPAPAPAPDVAGDPDELHGAPEDVAVPDATPEPAPELEDEPTPGAPDGQPAVEPGSVEPAAVPAAEVPPSDVERADDAQDGPDGEAEVGAVPPTTVPARRRAARKPPAEVALTEAALTEAALTEAAPAEAAPAEAAAAEAAPAEAAPAEAALTGAALTGAAPAETGPTRAALDEAAPVGRAAAEQASGTRSPAKQAPAKRAPATKAPATKAPARKAPAKRAPATKAPARKAPTAAAPAERAHASGADTAQTPASTPTVKRPVVRAVRADALRLGAPSTGGTTVRVAARGAAPAPPAPVVVVPDRERFHRPECRFVRGVAGATTLPKASAARQGYAACGVCKP